MTLTTESAKCISANLNSVMFAILENDKMAQIAAMCRLRANLYAVYYDVLPIISGRKAWPPINMGDIWDLNGKTIPYTNNELDLPELDF